MVSFCPAVSGVRARSSTRYFPQPQCVPGTRAPLFTASLANATIPGYQGLFDSATRAWALGRLLGYSTSQKTPQRSRRPTAGDGSKHRISRPAQDCARGPDLRADGKDGEHRKHCVDVEITRSCSMMSPPSRLSDSPSSLADDRRTLRR